ncbi:MAG: apolipoprotein N-acyltransferase [Polyangiales bacterium]
MRPYVLAAITGTLYFVSFAGFGIWPLAYVALVPILWALDPDVQIAPLRRRTVLLSGALFGLVLNVGGYYWVASTLRSFSGFSYVWCVLLASILWAYQGLEMALFAWLYHRGRKAGGSNLLASVLAMSLAEWMFPTLFKHYFGASLHNTPLAIQVADLGGPLLVTALVTAANAALYELSLGHRNGRIARRPVLVAAGMWAATLGYGAYRIHEVDARAAAAPKIQVGLVQTNMGLTQKRDDPEEGLKRHVAQSVEVQKLKKLDLLVWPESAFGWFLPADLKNVRDVVFNEQVHVPTLFGGLARRPSEDGKPRLFNTAFMTDADGTIVGTYDKTFLLAFGEYIPFGDVFPSLYDISPNSGRFTPGDHVQPVPLGPYRIGVLVCYEDILPSFVRDAVRVGTPHVLVNVTNDAWFGDTHAPWEHLALAKLRAVEHHRALVRSTNSGVSAVVDPVGRVLAQSKVFTRENLTAEVPMLAVDTPFLHLGDFPGYLSLLGFIALLVRGRKRNA